MWSPVLIFRNFPFVHANMRLENMFLFPDYYLQYKAIHSSMSTSMSTLHLSIFLLKLVVLK